MNTIFATESQVYLYYYIDRDMVHGTRPHTGRVKRSLVETVRKMRKNRKLCLSVRNILALAIGLFIRRHLNKAASGLCGPSVWPARIQTDTALC